MSAPAVPAPPDTATMLEQIRHAEHERTARIEAAQQHAETVIATARQQAARLKLEAREAARSQKDRLDPELINAAQSTARDSLSRAQQQADWIRQTPPKELAKLVQFALSVVTGYGTGDLP